MTNEELAIRIKAGETDLMGELWNQVENFTKKLAYEFITFRQPDKCRTAGLEIEDLFQISYFALEPAVKAFDAEKKYSFLTYLGVHLKNIFYKEIKVTNSGGKWYNRQDSLARAQSLNAPVYENKDSDELTLETLVPDEDSEEPFKDIEDRLYNEQLRADLEEAISSLESRDAQIIRDFYFNDLYEEALTEKFELSRSRVRLIRDRALQKLRGHKSLQSYREQIMGTAYTSSSLSSFKNNQASSTERIVMKLDEYARKFNIKY